MMFPPGQGRDSNPRCPPLTPGQPWDWAMVGGTGCRSLLRFFFFLNTCILDTYTLVSSSCGE